MYISILNNDNIKRILNYYPKSIYCFFIRSNTGKWALDDFKGTSLFSDEYGGLILCGFSRILRENDPIFSKIAEKQGKQLMKGKHLNEDWKLFGSFPLIDSFAFNKKKHIFELTSYVSGFAKLSFKVIEQNRDAFFSIVNSPKFASNGLFILNPSNNPQKSLYIENISKELNLIIKYKDKRYNSQVEWDNDLPMKQGAIINIIQNNCDNRAITLIPAINCDMEVGFFVFSSGKIFIEERIKNDNKFPISRIEEDWSIDLF